MAAASSLPPRSPVSLRRPAAASAAAAVTPPCGGTADAFNTKVANAARSATEAATAPAPASMLDKGMGGTASPSALWGVA